MACCNTDLTEEQLLAQILAQDVANFDRLQQLIQAVQATPAPEPAPACAGPCEYFYGYNLEVSATVAIGAPFPFDSEGPKSAGILHTPSPTVATSAPITVVNAGIYEIYFTATVAEARQIALYVNGAVDLSTIYGQATGTAVTTGFAILTLAANSIITLRNHLSAAALTLVTPSGGTAENTTNSIIIKQVA